MKPTEKQRSLRITLEDEEDEFFTFFVGIEGTPNESLPDGTMEKLREALALLRTLADKEFR